MSEHVIQLDFSGGVRVLPPLRPIDPSSIDIRENETFYEIRSTLPGVEADDVFVGVADHVLTIGARARAQVQRTLGRFLAVDHRVALFEQSFALPTDVDARHLTTSFRNGTLSVFLARVPVSNVVPLFAR